MYVRLLKKDLSISIKDDLRQTAAIRVSHPFCYISATMI